MANKKTKVEWIKSHPKYAYSVGSKCELSEDRAKELIKSKHVKLAKGEKEIKDPVCDLPEDLPARDILIAKGCKTMVDVRSITDFTEISGIGKSTNDQILAYLEANQGE